MLLIVFILSLLLLFILAFVILHLINIKYSLIINKLENTSIKNLGFLSEVSVLTQRLSVTFNKNSVIFSRSGFLLFVVTFLILYFYLPSINWIYNFIEYFSVKVPDINIANASIAGYVNAGTNFIGLFTSISLTLYFFTYRQRKSISISNINIGLKNNLISFIIVFISVLYGKMFMIGINLDTSVLYFTEKQYIRVLIFGLLFLVSLFRSLSIVRGMLKSVKLEFLLNQIYDRIIQTTEKLTYSISFSKKERYLRFKTRLFDYLYSCVESQYQMLILAANNNMSDLYRKNIAKWSYYLEDFMQGYKKPNVRVEVPLEKLEAINSNAFGNLYRSILENHVALTIALFEKNKLIEAEEALNIFFNLEPTHVYNNLRQTYMSSLHELILTVYLTHDVGFESALSGLESFCETDTSKGKNSGLRIYEDLLLKAVERNDLNRVSNIVYSMIKPIEDEEKISTNNKDLQVLLGFLKRYRNEDYLTKYRQCVMFIVLQSVLKSIELSNYACAGFLLKFTVTNFYSLNVRYSSDFNNTFKVFSDNIKQTLDSNPYMDKEAPHSFLPVSPNYNTNTLVYCLEKLSLLLFGQQKFSDLMELNRKQSEENKGRELIDVTKALSGNTALSYLFKKIILAKNHYGLIFLNENIFMLELEKEIRFMLR